MNYMPVNRKRKQYQIFKIRKLKDPKRASMLKLSATKEVPRTSHNLFLSVQKGKFHPNTKNGCYIVSLILIKLSIM